MPLAIQLQALSNESDKQPLPLTDYEHAITKKINAAQGNSAIAHFLKSKSNFEKTLKCK